MDNGRLETGLSRRLYFLASHRHLPVDTQGRVLCGRVNGLSSIIEMGGDGSPIGECLVVFMFLMRGCLSEWASTLVLEWIK